MITLHPRWKGRCMIRYSSNTEHHSLLGKIPPSRETHRFPFLLVQYLPPTTSPFALHRSLGFPCSSIPRCTCPLQNQLLLRHPRKPCALLPKDTPHANSEQALELRFHPHLCSQKTVGTTQLLELLGC